MNVLAVRRGFAGGNTPRRSTVEGNRYPLGVSRISLERRRRRGSDQRIPGDRHDAANTARTRCAARCRRSRVCESVTVDAQTGVLMIDADSVLDDADVLAAVDEAGYEAVRVLMTACIRRIAHRTRDRRHDVRVVRCPHREAAQPTRRRHGVRQLRDREGRGRRCPQVLTRPTLIAEVEKTGYTAAVPAPVESAGDEHDHDVTDTSSSACVSA